MFKYLGLIQLTPEGREALDKAPEYLGKFHHIFELVPPHHRGGEGDPRGHTSPEMRF
jgi:hypothetical protein